MIKTGYTHYWYTEPLSESIIAATSEDLEHLLPIFAEMGIDLADGNGEGKPQLGKKTIRLNGNAHCKHQKAHLGIAWPAKHAANIKTFANNRGTGTQETAETQIVGHWFAGAELAARTCGGDCSHESFILEPNKKQSEWREDKKLLFDCTKTAFKPYDLAVQCALICAQHHAKREGKTFLVRSDGEKENWAEAFYLCFTEFGYQDFDLNESDEDL